MSMEQRRTAYERWIEQEAVPVVEGYGVRDVRELALGPWKRLGGSGAYVQMKGLEGISGSLHHPLGIRVAAIRAGVYTSVKEGGTLIEYEDEDPEISRIYRAEMKKKGIASAMPGSSHAHGG